MLIREVYGSELNKGFLHCLEALYKNVATGEKACTIYRKRCFNIKTYGVVEDDEIIGTIALVVFSTYGHNGALTARIEDVAVREDQQRKGLGRLLVHHAIEQARAQGAYKVELSCKKHLLDFYSKCGFVETESTMRIDLN